MMGSIASNFNSINRHLFKNITNYDNVTLKHEFFYLILVITGKQSIKYYLKLIYFYSATFPILISIDEFIFHSNI
jgi:hypothetical protein